MTKLEPRTKSILQMLLCATLWSLAGIFIKLIPWSPFLIAGARSLVAGLVLFVYIKLKKLPFIFNKHTFLSGAMSCCVYLCFVIANKLTTAANAIVLQFTSPVFILLISVVLYKRRFSKGDVLAVLFTLAGISLFFFDQLGPGHLLGNFFGIAAGGFMGAMMVTMGEATPVERLSCVFIAQMLTAIVGLPFAFFTQPEITPLAVGSIVLLGVIQLGIPYILFALALENCPPLACSLLGAMEPLLNPVWVFLFDGEAPGLFALLGGVIVVVTITLWCVLPARKNKKTEA